MLSLEQVLLPPHAFLSCIAVLCLLVFVRFRRRVAPLYALPGPPAPSLLLGHLMETKGSIARWHTTSVYPEPFLSWIKQYGGAVHFRELWTHRVLVSDPKALQHILVTHATNYVLDPTIRAVVSERMFGVGLLSSVGAQHDQYRKLLQPTFSSAAIKDYIGIYARHASQWCDSVVANAAISNTPLHMNDLFDELTLGVIGDAAFNFDFHGNATAHTAYKEQKVEPSALLTAGMLSVPGFYRLPFAELQRQRRAKQVLRGIMEQVITEHKAGKRTLVSEILPKVSSHEALIHTMTFLTAGHETTAAALLWTFIMLAQHPEAAKAVRKECLEVMHAHGGSIATMEAIRDLKYTNAVIDETLRLNSVASLTRVAVDDDDHVPMDDGSFITIPQGTTITLIIPAIHRNPRYWSDPDKFVPERFLPGTPQFAKDQELRGGRGHSYFFLPFGIGSKNCIGQKFAIAEMAVVVATFWTKFDFAITDDSNTRHKLINFLLYPDKLNMMAHRL